MSQKKVTFKISLDRLLIHLSYCKTRSRQQEGEMSTEQTIKRNSKSPLFEPPCSIMMGLDLLADVFNRVRKKRKDLVFLSIKSLTLGMDPPEM